MTAKNDITNDKLISKPANDKYRENYDSVFSKFIRTASPEEKEDVYSKVIDEAIKMQNIPHFLKKQAD